MAEKYFVFLKDNRAVNAAVFASQDDDLANRIVEEQGYDEALWIGEDTTPARWSTYNPATKTFTPPTLDYLYEIGVSTENQAMYEARIAAEEAAKEE